VLEFDGLRQQLVIAMPLYKVGATHKGTVLRCSAIVVPQIEVSEIDWVGEGRPGQSPILMQAIHDRFGRENLGVCAVNHLFALLVDPIHERLGVALRADLFHVDLCLEVVGAVGRNGISEVPAEPVRWVVGHLEAVDAAHVAGRAGRNKHVPRGKSARIRIEVEHISLRREHNAVLGLVVDLHLRVVRPHMALTAGAGKAS
jgi:hypothetical protein